MAQHICLFAQFLNLKYTYLYFAAIHSARPGDNFPNITKLPTIYTINFVISPHISNRRSYFEYISIYKSYIYIYNRTRLVCPWVKRYFGLVVINFLIFNVQILLYLYVAQTLLMSSLG